MKPWSCKLCQVGKCVNRECTKNEGWQCSVNTCIKHQFMSSYDDTISYTERKFALWYMVQRKEPCQLRGLHLIDRWLRKSITFLNWKFPPLYNENKVNYIIPEFSSNLKSIDLQGFSISKYLQLQRFHDLTDMY